MNFYIGTLIGLFIGFGFGVGCALAVFYSIYTGGYRKAIEDSLREEKPPRYLQAFPRVQAKLEKERLAQTTQRRVH